MHKRVMALGLLGILGLSLLMTIPDTTYAKEINNNKEVVTMIEGNEVVERLVTMEEYEAFGEDIKDTCEETFKLEITEDNIEKIKSGDEVEAISTEDNSRAIACTYNWVPRNTSWSVKVNGLNDYKLGFTRFIIQNKFTRNGSQYTGSLYDNSIQLGLANNGTYTLSGKVGPIAGNIQTGDALYVTVKRGNTVVHSCVKSAR